MHPHQKLLPSKAQTLAHYLKVEADARTNASPLAESAPCRVQGDAEQRLAGGAADLMDTILDICLPPVHRAKCDCCNERPWTHRHDAFGIETYACDVCAP